MHLSDGQLDGAHGSFHHATGWFRKPTRTYLEHYGTGVNSTHSYRLIPLMTTIAATHRRQ